MRSNQYSNIILLFFVSFQLSLGIELPRLMSYEITTINNHTKEITISFIIDEKDFIYKDFIIISTDEPSIILSPWKSDHQSTAYYDPLFKATKQIFAKNFTLSVTAVTKNISFQPIHLYCSYYRNSDKKITQTLIHLFFDNFMLPSQSYDENDVKEAISLRQQKIFTTTTSVIDHFLLMGIPVAHNYVELLKCHCNYFLIFLIIITLLTVLLHFLQQHLKNYILKKSNRTITSLLTFCLFIGQFMYLHIAINPLITMPYATCSALIAGFFYIKKSTLFSTGFFHSFYTIFGMLSIIMGILLMFKVIQLWYPS